MNRVWRAVVLALSLCLSATAQSQYTITTFAGGNPTGIAATSIGISVSSVSSVAFPSPTL